MRLNEEQSEALAHELHKASYSGGSSAGMHFFSDAARCGMRALLNKRERAQRTKDPEQFIPPLEGENKERKQAFAVGSAYHKLHEMVRSGGNGLEQMRDGEMLTVNCDPFSASHIEAIRLFNGYMAHWPIKLWGDTVVTEHEFEAEVAGYKATAMPDLVTHLSEEDLPRAQKRCPQITEPGHYIIDFKTSDQPYDESYYRTSLQAMWYPYAWNEVYQDKPIRGMIFDNIYKFGRRKDKSIGSENFGAVFIPTHFTNAYPLLGMFEQAQENMRRAQELGKGNRSECFQFSFTGTNVCKFYANGCTNEVA